MTVTTMVATMDALILIHSRDMFRWCKPCWMPSREWRDTMDNETLRHWTAICKRMEQEERAWRSMGAGDSVRLQ